METSNNKFIIAFEDIYTMKIPKNELIAFAKPYLKERGFKKRNKRWTKNIGEFTLSFLIQISRYDKNHYYIRPGVFINALPKHCAFTYYGHFDTDIMVTSHNPIDVMKRFEEFCEMWTDKSKIKSALKIFIEWEERNPLEKRRADGIDYEKDPPSEMSFFTVTEKIREYILNNF